MSCDKPMQNKYEPIQTNASTANQCAQMHEFKLGLWPVSRSSAQILDPERIEAAFLSSFLEKGPTAPGEIYEI
jgi:hypothetical protein